MGSDTDLVKNTPVPAQTTFGSRWEQDVWPFARSPTEIAQRFSWPTRDPPTMSELASTSP